MSTPSAQKSLKSEAELLVAFVNSHDLEEETDSITTPAELVAWIAEQTGEYVAEPEAADLARVHALRESLRALLSANNGGEPTEAELTPLREAAERARYRPAFAADWSLSLEPARAGLSGFEARLLLAIEYLQCQDAWPRLKACIDRGCRWAFYDTTRNRSRTWCSMEECGNREKTRRYRSRRSAG